VNSGKRLFPGIHRSVNGWKIAQIPMFSSRFLAFGCIWDRSFSVPTGRHYSLTPTVFETPLIILQFHDLLATNVQGTQAYSLSQSKQQKQKALLILKI